MNLSAPIDVSTHTLKYIDLFKRPDSSTCVHVQSFLHMALHFE